MKLFNALLVPAIVTVMLTGFSARACADTSALISSLMSTLNVSEEQATGGAGAVFSAAKNKMAPQDFSTLTTAVPGIENLISLAPALGGSESAGMKGVSSMLGKMSGSADTMTGLIQAFGQLGLQSDMVGKFTDVILKYVDSEAGQTVMGLLKNALL